MAASTSPQAGTNDVSAARTGHSPTVDSQPWPRATVAGIVAAIVTLAPILTLGILSAAALGPNAAPVGIPAAFTAVAIGGTLVALFGRSSMPAAGLSSATIVIFASLFARIANDPALAPADAALAATSAMAVVVVGMGVLQLVFGRLGLASVAKFVPHPVLAGFMNAVAVLIVIGQLPGALGIASQAWRAGTAGIAALEPGALAVATTVACTIWLVAWRAPRWPAVLIGLCTGGMLAVLIVMVWPIQSIGPSAGTVVAALPRPTALLALFDPLGPLQPVLRRHGQEMATTSLLLAIIGTLETVLAGLATDHDAGHRHDPDRELMIFGGANVLSGLLGGLPVVFWRPRAIAILHARGNGHRAALAAALATTALFVVFAPALGRLPLAILAGVMVTVGVGLVDRWTWRLVGQVLRGTTDRHLLLNLAVVLFVFLTTLRFGFLVGVMAGVFVSLALFVRAMNRSLIRARLAADTRPSRRLYPPAREALLATRRPHVEILVLEGAFFFGNIDRLAAEMATIVPGTRVVVLDLRRVTTLDTSGAIALLRLGDQQAKRGIELLLSGVTNDNGHGRALRAAGADPSAEASWFPDADSAIEAAEALLLTGEATPVMEEIALAETVLMAGLTSAEVAVAAARMRQRSYAAGTVLFRTGDSGHSLFVLTRGSISILMLDDADRPGQRFVSFSPAMMFGETAMLDGKGRSASARADVHSVVYELSQIDLDGLVADDPQLGAKLYRNIGKHLSQRLRSASIAWRDAD
jgi:SulP family sulfate permease